LSRLWFIIFVACCGLLVCPGLAAHAAAGHSDTVTAGGSATSGVHAVVGTTREDIQAIQTFNKLRENEAGILKVEIQKKHKILFIMGICLLLGILTTAGLGLAMVLGGKPVFMWHMAIAGITVTLALAHAATAIIWFFPF